MNGCQIPFKLWRYFIFALLASIEFAMSMSDASPSKLAQRQLEQIVKAEPTSASSSPISYQVEQSHRAGADSPTKTWNAHDQTQPQPRPYQSQSHQEHTFTSPSSGTTANEHPPELYQHVVLHQYFITHFWNIVHTHDAQPTWMPAYNLLTISTPGVVPLSHPSDARTRVLGTDSLSQVSMHGPNVQTVTPDLPRVTKFTPSRKISHSEEFSDDDRQTSTTDQREFISDTASPKGKSPIVTAHVSSSGIQAKAIAGPSNFPHSSPIEVDSILKKQLNPRLSINDNNEENPEKTNNDVKESSSSLLSIDEGLNDLDNERKSRPSEAPIRSRESSATSFTPSPGSKKNSDQVEGPTTEHEDTERPVAHHNGLNVLDDKQNKVPNKSVQKHDNPDQVSREINNSSPSLKSEGDPSSSSSQIIAQPPKATAESRDELRKSLTGEAIRVAENSINTPTSSHADAQSKTKNQNRVYQDSTKESDELRKSSIVENNDIADPQNETRDQNNSSSNGETSSQSSDNGTKQRNVFNQAKVLSSDQNTLEDKLAQKISDVEPELSPTSSTHEATFHTQVSVSSSSPANYQTVKGDTTGKQKTEHSQMSQDAAQVSNDQGKSSIYPENNNKDDTSETKNDRGSPHKGIKGRKTPRGKRRKQRIETKKSDLETKKSDLETKKSDLETKKSDLETKKSDREAIVSYVIQYMEKNSSQYEKMNRVFREKIENAFIPSENATNLDLEKYIEVSYESLQKERGKESQLEKAHVENLLEEHLSISNDQILLSLPDMDFEFYKTLRYIWYSQRDTLLNIPKLFQRHNLGMELYRRLETLILQIVQYTTAVYGRSMGEHPAIKNIFTKKQLNDIETLFQLTKHFPCQQDFHPPISHLQDSILKLMYEAADLAPELVGHKTISERLELRLERFSTLAEVLSQSRSKISKGTKLETLEQYYKSKGCQYFTAMLVTKILNLPTLEDFDRYSTDLQNVEAFVEILASPSLVPWKQSSTYHWIYNEFGDVYDSQLLKFYSHLNESTEAQRTQNEDETPALTEALASNPGDWIKFTHWDLDANDISLLYILWNANWGNGDCGLTLDRINGLCSLNLTPSKLNELEDWFQNHMRSSQRNYLNK